MVSPRLNRRSLATALFALLIALPARSQDTARRLILKDGSYQLVTKYEVKGDRVRYYSSEREDWEELPNKLVDWDATNQYEKERQANTSAPEAVALDKELAEESARAEARLPEVAPGLRLPEDQGIFLLDTFQGEPQIVELQQTQGDINRNTKANILKGAINPIAGQKATIELAGAHATIQAHVEVPGFYIKIEEESDQSVVGNLKTDSTKLPQQQPASQPQQPQQPQQAVVPFNRFRIVHTDVKNGKRIVGDVKRQVTGKVSQEQKFVKTTITQVSGGWLKLTPIEPLTAGEYALVELEGEEGMNLYVWDFGVNPKAPANANPWKPEAKTETKPTAPAKP
jgi:hypothetical protein